MPHCQKQRHALPEQLLYYCERLLEAQRRGEELSVAALKGYFQSGRRLTVELLEFFDSIHFPRRQGDSRVVVNPAIARERFGAKAD